MKYKSIFSLFVFTGLGLAFLFPGCEQTQKAPSNVRVSSARTDPTRGVGVPLLEVAWRLDSLPDGAKVSTIPRYVLLVDGSGSMNEDRKVDDMKAAFKEFLSGIQGNAIMSLITFDASRRSDHEVNLKVPPGLNNQDEIIRTIEAMRCDRGTPLGEGIKMGVDVLVEQARLSMGYAPLKLIVFTDGEDNGRVGIMAAGTYALQRYVPIYTIGFKMRNEHDLYFWSLWHTSAHSRQELLEGLKSTLSESDEGYDTTTYTQ